MAHIKKVRTEKEAKLKGWPCWMCINGERIIRDVSTGWRDGFCQKCRVNRARAKPSEFYLKRVA